MPLTDVGFYLRGRLSTGLSRVLNRRRRAAPVVPPADLDEVARGPVTPLALTRLLEGRTNPERQAALAAYLAARSVPFARHRFASFEGRGENFSVDVGHGDRVLILAAHHDAVPGSPGANDNAASVAILLTLLERVARRPAGRTRLRLLFPACEELGYLGARAYVRDTALRDVTGVLSLELCGVGDSLAVWDAGADTPFLRQVCGSFEERGLRADETYHVVGRIPVFGSDHRAFAARGLPAYGLTVVPTREAEALRRFVFHPVRGLLRQAVRRPPPFDTYHTSRDASVTLDATALDRVVDALEAVVTSVR